ncbi:LptF/LptG family permease [Salinibius halmophilus]|uniref:LptF/LptG family permease n=1 Tax=Salinibius halmophilus TaxID=1853216 RepID=UPI000E67369A|nr:LptF/LptG family permease [Salinibius halmophilus]
MIIWRYLCRQIFSKLLLVAISVSLLELLITMMGELTYSDLSMGKAALVTVMETPLRMTELAPVVFLVALLVTLGGLANSSELVVMQACGITKLKIIAFSAMLLVSTHIAWLITIDYVKGPLSHATLQIRDGVGDSSEVFSGVFMDAGKLVAAQVDGDALKDVRQFEINDGKIEAFQHAPNLAYDERRDRWLAEDVSALSITPNGLVQQVSDSTDIDISATPEVVQYLFGQSASLSFVELVDYKMLSMTGRLYVRKMEVAFWDRLSQPITTFALLLLSASFVFGSTRKVSASERIIQGTVIGVALVLVQDLLAAINAAVAAPAFVFALLPAALVFVVASYRLVKA